MRAVLFALFASGLALLTPHISQAYAMGGRFGGMQFFMPGHHGPGAFLPHRPFARGAFGLLGGSSYYLPGAFSQEAPAEAGSVVIFAPSFVPPAAAPRHVQASSGPRIIYIGARSDDEPLPTVIYGTSPAR